MASEAVIGAGIGALAAIAGGFLAQRFQHILDVRDLHHQDLVTNILVPWKSEVERQISFLTGYGPANYVSASTDNVRTGYKVRADDLSLSLAAFPPDTPLWERCHEHWPALSSAWDAVLGRLLELDRLFLEFIRGLESSLPAPPEPAWGFQGHHSQYPDLGRRFVAAKIWSSSGVWQPSPRQREEFSKWLNKFEPYEYGIPPASKAKFAEVVEDYFSSRQVDVEQIRIRIGDAHMELREVQQMLLRSIHDRNLPGRCEYCPQYFGRLLR